MYYTNYTLLYYATLYYIITYYVILYSTVLYSTLLFLAEAHHDTLGIFDLTGDPGGVFFGPPFPGFAELVACFGKSVEGSGLR